MNFGKADEYCPPPFQNNISDERLGSSDQRYFGKHAHQKYGIPRAEPAYFPWEPIYFPGVDWNSSNAIKSEILRMLKDNSTF